MIVAGLVGFAGNEAVAVFRIRVRREINSAALIADGYHARTDGLISLAIVAGALRGWAGFPLADPIVGLLITVAILGIDWRSTRSVLTRMLDGVEPQLIDEIEHAAAHVPGIKKITEIKARWFGHKLHIDAVISVDEGLLLTEAQIIAALLKHELFEHLPALSAAHVRFGQLADDHSHAPAPVRVDTSLARGLLQTADTDAGQSPCVSDSHVTLPTCGQLWKSTGAQAASRRLSCVPSRVTTICCNALARRKNHTASGRRCNCRQEAFRRSGVSEWKSRTITIEYLRRLHVCGEMADLCALACPSEGNASALRRAFLATTL